MEEIYRVLRQKCFGREQLQKQMQDAYDLAAAGTPQFQILLGSTGMGKTRLAQELYRWLTLDDRDPSTDEFPQGYWPDSFIEEALKDDVNPRFDDRLRPEIPFLWWGLRFAENRPPWEALEQSRHLLGVHSVHVAQRRNIAAQDRDGWWQLFGLATTGAGLIPGVGAVANWVALSKEGWDAAQRIRQRQSEQQSDESNAAASDRINAERIDGVVNTLGMFLDPSCSDAPTVPVVLFLDDAHWMDSLTLEIVRRLWTAATDGGWKLLIVATHWDDEWQTQSAEQPQPNSPQRLAGFVESVALPEQADIIHKLPICGVPRDALSDWILSVLPGLSDYQVQVLIDKARAIGDDTTDLDTGAGSPRVCEELMKMLIARPNRFFVDGDLKSQLLESAEIEIRDQILDLRDIVKTRFESLGSDVRLALGWSSLQGVRFLNEITRAIARKLDFAPAENELADSIASAEQPHCWIERIQQTGIDPGRFNLCEFRSNVFREVAQHNLDIAPNQQNAIESAITETLESWLLSGRFQCPQVVRGDDGQKRVLINEDDLTIGERRDALRMAIAKFRPQQNESFTSKQWHRYGLALAQSVQLDTSGPEWGEPIYWEQAERTAIEFALSRPDGWPLDDLETFHQITLTDLLE